MPGPNGKKSKGSYLIWCDCGVDGRLARKDPKAWEACDRKSNAEINKDPDSVCVLCNTKWIKIRADILAKDSDSDSDSDSARSSDSSGSEASRTYPKGHKARRYGAATRQSDKENWATRWYYDKKHQCYYEYDQRIGRQHHHANLSKQVLV